DAQRDYIIGQLASQLSVHQLGKDFIQIQLKSPHSEGMDTLLTSVSEHFIEQLLAPERSSIKDSSHFLNMHITKRREQLDKAELAYAEYKNAYSHATPEMQSQSLARLASLKQTLAEKEAELAGVERSLGSLDQQLSKTNPVIGKIEEQIIEIRSELTLLRARYTEAHSLVQGKLRELQRLEQERSILIKSSKFESLTEETISLKKMVTELEYDANRFGSTTTDINRLARDVSVKRELYEDLVERYEMAQLTGSLGSFEEGKRVKVIDEPFVPSSPSNLPAIVFVLLGFVGGAGLGISLATILELIDNSVRSKQSLVKSLGVPVITVI
ncbi:GNVR domain-containing protein, partial [Vibrio rotiferianus]